MRGECEHGTLRRKCPDCERDEEIAELKAEVARLEQESAGAFVDFLTTEGVLLDYGSNVGRETPEDALKRFRTALAEKMGDR